MPGHLAWLDNNYSKAVRYFTAAELVDRNYLQQANISPADYWSYQHNLAYRIVAELEAGEINAAQQSMERAAELYENYPAKGSQMQWHRLQSAVGSRIFRRGGRWQASKKHLISLPLIDGEQRVRLLHSSALAILDIDSNNPPDDDTVVEAEKALEDLREHTAKHSEDSFLQMLLYEAEAVVSAMHRNGKATVKNFQQALHFERLVNYEEPPLRVRTIHETAGQTFCHFGSFDFGVQMYQQAIAARPNNGHALQGLIACLAKKGDTPQSAKFKAQLEAIWPTGN
jgi:tetratricopeptide (TPR) repeat protein